MAVQLGIKQNTYCLWEQGKGLTEDGVKEIAKILAVPEEELLNGEPLAVIMNHNHGNNGHVNIEHQQQHMVPQDLLERILQQNEDRAKVLEDLLRQQMELLSRWMGKN